MNYMKKFEKIVERCDGQFENMSDAEKLVFIDILNNHKEEIVEQKQNELDEFAMMMDFYTNPIVQNEILRDILKSVL